MARQFLAGKSKGKSAHVQAVTYAELRRMLDYDSYWASLERELEEMRTFFARQLTLRYSY